MTLRDQLVVAFHPHDDPHPLRPAKANVTSNLIGRGGIRRVAHGRPYSALVTEWRAKKSQALSSPESDFVFDTASESEPTHFDAPARNEGVAVYADSACRSKARVAALEGRGVFPGICHRRVRGQKELTPVRRRFNKLIAPIRALVELPFAWIKRMNGGEVRYRGCRRNGVDFPLAAVAYNSRRAFTIVPKAAAVAAAG